jgi:predicted MFS family arabinose efflux permease
MLAGILQRRLAAHGVHYGWVVVAAAFVVSVSTAGVMGLPGALMLPLEREFGWSATDVSNALAIRILLYGLMAPFSAALMERFGVKRVVVAAVVTIGAMLLLSMGLSSLWQLTALFGVGLGIGTGLTAVVFSAIISTRWFTARRGLVIGLLTASNATGQLAFLPLAAWLESRYGWRIALLPSLFGLALAAAMAILFLVDRPYDLGLVPYGETGKPVPPSNVRPALSSSLRVLGQVAPMPAFWVLAGTFFVCGLSTNGLVQTHFISLCADNGVASVTAASMLALIGFCDFFGTIGSGWLSDRYDNRALLFVYYGLRGLSLLYLPSSGYSIIALSAFSVFYGLDWVATVPPTARLSAEIFGRERTGVVFGWIFASHMIGAAFAAFLGGFARTVWHTYLPAFYLGGIACLVAALAIWLIDRKQAAQKTLATA